MAIQRGDPWNPLSEIERRMEDAMSRPLSLWRRPLMRWMPSDGMLPAIEMFDKKDKLIVRAEIPGVKPEDIDVSISDSTLTIKAERKSETEVKEEDYYRSEMSYGRFFRSVSLPEKVQPDQIDANYDDGILEITLTKILEAKPRKVAVKTKSKSK